MTRPGESVGAYQLVRHLGEGPFGVVWLARAADGSSCALKLLRPGFVDRPEGQASFERLSLSISIHARLNHPNLCRIYGPVHDEARRLFGIATEHVAGQTLAATVVPASVVEGQDLKNLGVVLSWFEELGAVLSWLHSQRIVHGNLKPTNIVLSQAGGRSLVKVLDLSWAAIGIAAPSPGGGWSLAPEQLAGQPPSIMSDQWALASMLTRMVSGGAPVLKLGVLPQVLVMSLQRALENDPAKRYPHMSAFVSALRAIRMEVEQRARATTPPGPQSDGRGTVDPRAFEEEPDTVRAQNLMRQRQNGSAARIPDDRMDTPPLSLPPGDLHATQKASSTPFSDAGLPELSTREISRQESGQFVVPPPSPKPLKEKIPPTDSSGPKRRHDVGDPFSQPISSPEVGPEFSGVNILIDEPVDVDLTFEAPTLDPQSNVLPPENERTNPLPDDEPGPTSPSTPVVAGGRSRLTAIGVLFMVIAAVIAVAALTILGEESAPDQTASRVAKAPPTKKVEAPAKAPPRVEAPPPVKAPPAKAPPAKVPPPAKTRPPPAKTPPPARAQVPPPPKRPAKPTKPAKPSDKTDGDEAKPASKTKPPPSEEIEALEDQADAALAKLLNTPPSKADLSVSCDEGNGAACVQLAEALGKKKYKEARRAYERGCTFGIAEGCHEAAVLYAADPVRAKQLEAQACKLGRAASCPAPEPPPPPPPPPAAPPPAKTDSSSAADDLK